MPLIVNQVVRYTVNQTFEGNQVANIWDTRIDTTGGITDRNDAIQDHAGDIITAWHDEILLRQVNDLTLDSVSWVDLNSPTGSTGSRSSTDTINLPVPGTAVGPSAASNLAVLVAKQIIGDREHRNGRLYMSGLAESYSEEANGNILTASIQGILQTAWDQFRTDLEGQFLVGGLPYDAAPCVVHVLTRDEDGHPLTGDSTDIESMAVDGLLATQRRRLRR